jgi:AcrR family transcriptional regulator
VTAKPSKPARGTAAGPAASPTQPGGDASTRGSSTTASPRRAAAPAGWRDRVIERSLGPALDRAVDRGQLLITAASRLISAEGVECTVQNVAREAGVSLRVFYQHFASKDDLLIALTEESQIVFAHLLEQHAATFSDPLERIGGALYFAADERQHTSRSYNAALSQFASRTALAAPERVGAARRPVVEVFTDLVDEAMVAGAVEPGNPEVAAYAILTLYHGYQQAKYLGNRTGGTMPSREQFVRFCVNALGARVPVGWEDRFTLTDSQADPSGKRTRDLSPQGRRQPDPITRPDPVTRPE